MNPSRGQLVGHLLGPVAQAKDLVNQDHDRRLALDSPDKPRKPALCGCRASARHIHDDAATLQGALWPSPARDEAVTAVQAATGRRRQAAVRESEVIFMRESLAL